MNKIAVVYWSGTGNTESMAASVADGARKQGAEADLFQVSDFDASMLENYDALAFGCPAMGSEELESEEFQPLWDEVKDQLGERKVVLFGSYEWADGEWLENWKADAEDASVNVVDSLAVYDAPGPQEQAACQALGAVMA